MLSISEINEIAAKQALSFVYDARVLDLKNVYHYHQTDGLNSSNFYDLYRNISLSCQAKLLVFISINVSISYTYVTHIY